MGLPHAIYISTANVTDRNGALEAFALKTATLTAVSNVIVDSAYSFDKFCQSSTKILNVINLLCYRNDGL